MSNALSWIDLAKKDLFTSDLAHEDSCLMPDDQAGIAVAPGAESVFWVASSAAKAVEERSYAGELLSVTATACSHSTPTPRRCILASSRKFDQPHRGRGSRLRLGWYRWDGRDG
jgi:hypothetical protein